MRGDTLAPFLRHLAGRCPRRPPGGFRRGRCCHEPCSPAASNVILSAARAQRFFKLAGASALLSPYPFIENQPKKRTDAPYPVSEGEEAEQQHTPELDWRRRGEPRSGSRKARRKQQIGRLDVEVSETFAAGRLTISTVDCRAVGRFCDGATGQG